MIHSSKSKHTKDLCIVLVFYILFPIHSKFLPVDWLYVSKMPLLELDQGEGDGGN